ncbi:acyltransferase [Gordonia sp. (in: high G+C Gram-positive bacteria)]|uniref:acyltransferase n=1 Tax=Gordonia sp. (in: high G+C Gram-positive bacteria) TaxID=84139 RepID=UPI0016B7C903|nr:acyltransferase [Gordonia sp. (in: high G+C Gram-positive bacteria)]NLG46063.1 acyltransferase [Gordonia sp. (in: high G+C Gram-positive bacteria)]
MSSLTVAPEVAAGSAGSRPSITGTTPPSASTEVASPKRPYLHHVDLIRTTTFALVIFMHVMTSTTAEFENMGVNATALLLHGTRNIFFALTGFVLMYQYLDRPDFRATSFWRRRMKLVIVPYLVWSALYWVITVMWVNARLGEVPTSLDELGEQLMWGTAAYHLYFLLVMLQAYLLFPLLRKLIMSTRGHHGKVLAVSVAVQVTVLSLISYWTPPAGFAAEMWGHLYATVVPYQLLIVIGALAAAHRDRVAEMLRGRGELIGWLFLATGMLAIGAYAHRVIFNGAPIHDPGSPFELTLLPFIVVAVVALYALALHWTTHHRAHMPIMAKVVSYASNRSFPVFLVHVMVLFFLLYPKTDDGQKWLVAALPQPLATLTVYLLTVTISLAIVEVLRRLPGSLYLTGRPRLPLKPMI